MTSSEQEPGGTVPEDAGASGGQDARQPGRQEAGRDDGPAAGEPAKKHGDPLLGEAEGEQNATDAPSTS